MTAMFLFPEDARRSSREGWRLLLWIAAAGGLWLAYALVFVGTAGAALGDAVADGAANVAPLIALALAARFILPAQVMRRPPPVQAVLHALLAAAFALAWYACVVLLLAIVRAARTGVRTDRVPRAWAHLAGVPGPDPLWRRRGRLLRAAPPASRGGPGGGRPRPPPAGALPGARGRRLPPGRGRRHRHHRRRPGLFRGLHACGPSSGPHEPGRIREPARSGPLHPRAPLGDHPA